MSQVKSEPIPIGPPKSIVAPLRPRVASRPTTPTARTWRIGGVNCDTCRMTQLCAAPFGPDGCGSVPNESHKGLELRVLITGGAGFVGSALVRHLVLARGDDVCTVDKLTYAGSLDNLAGVEGRANHRFERIEIRDRTRMRDVIAGFAPDALMHLAAESHVDRSIDGPDDFIQTNVMGTYALLESVREYRQSGGRECRFIHVSTDEVYGSVGHAGTFTEDSPHRPNSPYAASKAASDQLARAWWKTFGLPVITTHSSNNYGPRQFAEKLIPLATLRALEGRTVPVYGDGRQVRDWLHVDDHVRALEAVLDRGLPGRTYNIGAGCEKTNIEVVETVLKAVAVRSGLDEGNRAPARRIRRRPARTRPPLCARCVPHHAGAGLDALSRLRRRHLCDGRLVRRERRLAQGRKRRLCRRAPWPESRARRAVSSSPVLTSFTECSATRRSYRASSS